VHQSGAVIGAAMQPKPYGFWGLLDKDLNTLPGYGTPEHDKAKARKLLAEAGFTGPITSVATSTAASSTARASR
jgi:ABC-type transport system substrate-binding protein